MHICSKGRLFLMATLFAVLSLTSCQGAQPGSESITSSGSSSSSLPSRGEYYNEENFIPGTKVITKTKLVTYEGPSLLKSSEKVNVVVNDINLFVYETRVNHGRKFSWELPETTNPYVIFDFEGKVHLDITINADTLVTSAIVSPQVYGIVPSIEGNVISFDLEYNGNYVVEYNNNPDEAIHIFANPIETETMSKEEADLDDKKIYVGPGVYNASAFPVSDGTQIYLAGGSYVYGNFKGEFCKDVKIFGRGIISGSIYNRRSEAEFKIPVEFNTCENVVINDIAFMDPAGWTFAFIKCKNVRINNVKMITARQNGDGISIQSCEDVIVKGGFVRTWDDSLVVKNVDRGNTKDILFDGVTVWTDLAQSMEVGYETNGPKMENITFQNITVLHNFHKALISCHNCDDAVISGVTYKNITLEDGQMLGDDRKDLENDFLMDFTIAFNPDWTKSEGARGVINGVTIENVHVYRLLDSIISRFNGESPTSKISNVNIKGYKINGKFINTFDEFKVATNEYVENITYSKLDKVLGSYISLPYTLSLASSDVEKTIVPGIHQDGILIPEFAYLKGGLPYIGVKGNIKCDIAASHGAGSKTNTPVDDGSGEYTRSGTSVQNLMDNDPKTVWSSKDWKKEESEFAGLTMDFASVSKVGKIRIRGSEDNAYFFTFSIQVWVKKLKADGSINDKYTRYSATKDYEMSPASGNCIDINITATDYAGIQLRLYRNDTSSGAPYYTIGEIEFYPPSLTYGKTVVDASEFADVYNVEKCVDGDPATYYESKELPALIVIDLGQSEEITTIVLCLPPLLTWSPRTQKIAFYGSESKTSYTKETEFFEVIEEKEYLFDPTSGNRVTIELSKPVSLRFFKMVITSNSNPGGYGGQVSEVSVYGA